MLRPRRIFLRRTTIKKLAFTLAEVLLTLAIIGVVAALTIPAVITKVQQDQYVVGLKKAYNTLKSVERQAIQEHGEMANWTYTGGSSPAFTTYFKPHFDILKDCGNTDDGCFASSYLSVKGEQDEDIPNFNTTDWMKIITSDGVSYAYYVSASANLLPGSARGLFYVDVNGKKAPNRAGRDLFGFNVFPQMGIKPEGAYNSAGGAVVPSNSGNTLCTMSGYGCAAKVLAEGAMNY